MKWLSDILFPPGTTGEPAAPTGEPAERIRSHRGTAKPPIAAEPKDAELSAAARAMGRKGGKKRAANAKRVEPADALKNPPSADAPPP